MPASLAEFRSRPGLLFLIALICGVIAGLAVVVYWVREDAHTGITVVNTGDGLTVLISDERHHLLIVSGRNGSAFANAIDDLTNPLTGAFDLILIDPSSSADVQERARALESDEFRMLPGEDSPGDLNQPITIHLSSEVSVYIEADEATAWDAVVSTSAGAIGITPRHDDGTSPFPVSIQTADGVAQRVTAGSVLIIPASDGQADQPGVLALAETDRLIIIPDDANFRIQRT